MFKILREQSQTLDRIAFARFAARAGAWLEARFPRHCRRIGQPGFGQLVVFGTERALSHRILLSGNVESYLALMLQFGSEFDVDPQLPWARNALANESRQHETQVMKNLVEQAATCWQMIAGPDAHFVDAALRKAARWLRESQPPHAPKARSADTVPDLLNELRSLYPQKFDYVGEATLRQLHEDTLGLVSRAQMERFDAERLLLALCFFLGSGFDRDLQFPWISEILNEPLGMDPLIRVRRLHSQALEQLRSWL